MNNFDVCANRHGGNQESTEANDSMGVAKVVQGYRVAQFLHEQGSHGATTEEVVHGLLLSHQSASARMSELKALKIIVPTANRRPTASGRMARVCVHKMYAESFAFNSDTGNLICTKTISNNEVPNG